MIVCKYSKYYCIKNKKGGDFSPILKVLYPYFYLPFFVAEYSALAIRFCFQFQVIIIRLLLDSFNYCGISMNVKHIVEP